MDPGSMAARLRGSIVLDLQLTEMELAQLSEEDLWRWQAQRQNKAAAEDATMQCSTGTDNTTEDSKRGNGGGDYVLGTELLAKKAKMGCAFKSFSRVHAHGQHDVYEGGTKGDGEATKTTQTTASEDFESLSPVHAYGPHDEVVGNGAMQGSSTGYMVAGFTANTSA